MLTVPNIITSVRLCLIPVFVWLLFGRDNRAGAAVMLAALGATDWVDGAVARKFNQVSNLGKILDPVADRLLLGTGVICILIDGAVPAVVAIPVVGREVLVSLAVLALAALGAKRIDVTWAGKMATFANMVAFPLFLLSHDEAFSLRGPARAIAWTVALVGIGFGYYSLAKYVPIGKAALREGRAGRAGSDGRGGNT